MHFEGRLCQQNSRIPVFVRKLFVYFVIRKEIEHKNVKRQVLEPLPANGSLKKSQPIARQVRFDCLQNLEIWSLFQGLAATHTAICEWWVEFFIAAQFVKNLRQRFQPLKWRFWMILAWAISEIPPVLVTRPVHRRRNSLSFFTEGLFLWVSYRRFFGYSLRFRWEFDFMLQFPIEKHQNL